jgi:hypothetical protein
LSLITRQSPGPLNPFEPFMTAVAGFCPLFDAARQPLVSEIPDLRHTTPRRIEEKCLTAIVSEGRMSGKERQEFAKVSQRASSPIPRAKI